MIAPLAALIALGLQGPPAVDSALVSTAWLREHLHDANLVLLHIGTRPGYDSAHIPGAHFIELREIAAPPGPGPLLELPTAARMDSTLAAHGISSESRIVLYWGADWFTPTARVYLTLTWAGLGELLMSRLRDLQQRHELIGDVRGKGLYVGVEIVKDSIGRERDNAMMHRIRWNALEEGLLIAGSSNVLKMFPALIIEPAEIDEGVEKLERAIRRAMDGHPRGVDRFTTTSVT